MAIKWTVSHPDRLITAMVISNKVVAESAKIFQAVSGADRQVQIFRDLSVAPGLAGRDGTCWSHFTGYR
jgi:hypothetical protein